MADNTLRNTTAGGDTIRDMIAYASAATATTAKLISGSKYRVRTIPIKCRVIGG